MPNIELHGFGAENGEDTIQLIQKIFTGITWQDEYVTTHVFSDVQDHRGCEQPYFRVFGTKQSEIDALATILAQLGYDIELMPPITFLPKKK